MKPLGAAVVAVLLLAGCLADAPAPTSGQQTFASMCTTCHGRGGQGDGPIATDLPVAPADLTMLAAVNDGVFPRDRVMTQIYGYPGKYHSSVMPEFGPLLEGATVTITTADGSRVETPRALVDLVDYIETLQRP